MRQTLLRIRLDDIWSTAAVDGVTGIGLGYLLLFAWTLVAVKWAVTAFRGDGFSRDDLPGALVWLGSLAIVLTAGQWLLPQSARYARIGQIESTHGGTVIKIDAESNDGIRAGSTLYTFSANADGEEEAHSIQVSRFIGPRRAQAEAQPQTPDDGYAAGDLVFTARAIPVFGYGFMLFLGFFSAAWLAMRRATSVGLAGELIWDLAVWIMIAGIGGARLLFVFRFPEKVFHQKVGLAKFLAIFNLPDGGLVLYGGVILACAAFFWFCHRRNVKPLLLADVVMPSIFVGLAFGRLGCFLNGCCYGDTCSLPWAVQFPKVSATFSALVSRGFLSETASATMPLHPTQIYSSINAIFLALLTATYFRHRQRDGAVLALSLCTYPVTRFIIEYLRSDELTVVMTVRTALFWGRDVVTFNTPFTTSQWISLLLFSSGLIFAYWLQRREAETSIADRLTAHGSLVASP